MVGFKASSETDNGIEKVKNPGPKPAESQVPDHVKTLTVDLPKAKLDSDTIRGLRDFRRAADYIAAGLFERIMIGYILPSSNSFRSAMIFLTDNVLLERDLTFSDIKPRLLGKLSDYH